MVFIILQGCFPCSNVSIIRECECTNGTYGSYYGLQYNREAQDLQLEIEIGRYVCKSTREGISQIAFVVELEDQYLYHKGKDIASSNNGLAHCAR